MKKLARQNSENFIRRASVRLNKTEDFLAGEAKPELKTLDSFELKYTPNKLKLELFLKINKAMRQEMQTAPNIHSGALELAQILALEDMKKIKSLSRKQLQHAYLEGVYVAERYCALVDPGDSAVTRNAETYMAEYLHYLKLHKHDEEELYWIKKDYLAGTAGEDVEADALLLKRAKKFYWRLQRLNLEDSSEQIHKATLRIIKKDTNGLAAFIALRRALFA